MKYDKRVNRKLLCLLAVSILVMGVGVFSYIYYNFYKLSYIENESRDAVSVIEAEKIMTKEEEKIEEFKNIRNVLIIGVDTRAGEEHLASRSDTMMILTVDEMHNKLKITSIMRDTYADIPGYEPQKLNHSYAYGGADLLLKSLSKTFNISINDYIIINFKGFKNIIDTIGGIEVEVNSDQIEDLNNCMYGLSEENIIEVPQPGKQRLNGMQALAYARMRHTGDGTYDRVKRQREIVQLVIDKLQEAPISKYPILASNIFQAIKTNISFGEAAELVLKAYTIKCNSNELEQLQIPVTKLSKAAIYGDKGWVIMMDKEGNSEVLKNFIFNDIKYDESKYIQYVYEEIVEYTDNEKDTLNKSTDKKERLFEY